MPQPPGPVPGGVVDTVPVTLPGAPPTARAHPPGRRRVPPGLPELALLLIGAEICRHLGWPIRTVGLAFAAGAVVTAVLAFLGARRACIHDTWSSLVVTLGFVAAVGLTFAHIVLLLSGVFLRDYETCVDLALTSQAEQACQERLERTVRDRLIGSSDASGAGLSTAFGDLRPGRSLSVASSSVGGPSGV